ncbi:MAG: hypothetical protein JWN94_2762 [Betaproteobacteria bacterium]|nr:hypothetical protein [Betaproteobacteria bacterium]
MQAALAGTERLWKVWWLIGIPVAWATSGMIIGAEMIRAAGYWNWGDLIDVARLVVYFGWARMAWRCSNNVENRRWTPVTRLALGAGFVSMAMF